jgi:CRP/FNR family transcriptional regulator, polysaccharide utilization system transcription regulator
MKENEKKLQMLLSIYPELSVAECELLAENSHEIEYNTGEIIFKESAITSHVFFINQGLVKLVREHKNNRTIILDIVPGGQFIGFVSLMGTKQYYNSAKAIAPCKILTLYSEVFVKVMVSNPAFTLRLIAEQSKQNLQLINHLIQISQKQLPGRVADVLLFFNELYEKLEYSFPLSRRELAEFAGTSKESLIRTLSEFNADKIIEIIDNKKIKIKSLDIVERLSKYG